MESGRPFQEKQEKNQAEDIKSQNSPGKFIYKLMTVDETYDELTKSGKTWLLRESSKTGMLTAALKTSPDKYGLFRFALLENGWVCIDPENADAVAANFAANNLTIDHFTKHVDGLLELLAEKGYTEEDIALPNGANETKKAAYIDYIPRLKPKEETRIKVTGRSDYILPQQEEPEKAASAVKHIGLFSPSQSNETYLELPKYIVDTLCCPLASQNNTKPIKLMKNPVTLVNNSIPGFPSGISYEKNKLLKEHPELQEGVDYYPNQNLKHIINYLSSTHLERELYLEKLEKINEYEIKDAVFFDEFQNPYLLPNGLSYEKNTIVNLTKNEIIKDPTTRELFASNQVVENTNLKNFTGFWIEHRDEYLSKINNSLVMRI